MEYDDNLAASIERVGSRLVDEIPRVYDRRVLGELPDRGDGLRHLMFHSPVGDTASVCGGAGAVLEADTIEDTTCRRCLSLSLQYFEANKFWMGLERARDRLAELGPESEDVT